MEQLPNITTDLIKKLHTLVTGRALKELKMGLACEGDPLREEMLELAVSWIGITSLIDLILSEGGEAAIRKVVECVAQAQAVSLAAAAEDPNPDNPASTY